MRFEVGAGIGELGELEAGACRLADRDLLCALCVPILSVSLRVMSDRAVKPTQR